MSNKFLNLLESQIKELVDSRYTDSIVAHISDGDESRDISFGKSNLNSNTLFQIASITKTFSAMALNKYLNRGEVSLDSIVGEFYKINPSIDSVTIRELLTHHSGAPRDFKKYLKHRDNLYSYLDNKEILTQLNHMNFSSKKEMLYSNVNAALIGMIIEKLSGNSVKDVIAKNVFNPARMSYSSFSREKLSIGYSSWGLKTPAFDMNGAFNAVGGITSNIDDLKKFIDYLLKQEEMFTSLKSLEEYNLGKFCELLENDNILLSSGVLKGHSSVVVVDKSRGRSLIVLCNTGVDITKLVYSFIGLDPDIKEKKNIA